MILLQCYSYKFLISKTVIWHTCYSLKKKWERYQNSHRKLKVISKKLPNFLNLSSLGLTRSSGAQVLFPVLCSGISHEGLGIPFRVPETEYRSATCKVKSLLSYKLGHHYEVNLIV